MTVGVTVGVSRGAVGTKMRRARERCLMCLKAKIVRDATSSRGAVDTKMRRARGRSLTCPKAKIDTTRGCGALESAPVRARRRRCPADDGAWRWKAMLVLPGGKKDEGCNHKVADKSDDC